ncbi:AAA family ATPase [Georgenia sp. SYP-B2076]|uniref:AAA family ATPase n=1 Tax=Georgenia sp. SYP-B2076 TaxID=2495881 RepID=UPI000F8D7591|nr:SMC family ATPase [Georgenia sp. SYP-B2076]
MRIHRLTLEAIGPFPGRHTIDFDALSAGGLFLLEGPTGSGKSTLIDAVVFALYGKVAGAEASDDRLHSDHAAPDVEPFVELTFSTAAGIYRVWRSPAFQRPKKRGGGFTAQNARAKLWRLAEVDTADGGEGGGEPISAHVQEVGGELGRIVVLDRAQFTQTVVLPQGQFASFLRAKPEDRRAVLQDVFGTEVYEQLQKQLAEMARSARAAVERASVQIGAATAAFVSTVGRAADDEGSLTGPARARADQPEADAEDDVTVLLAAAETLDGDVLTERTAQVCSAAAAAADRAREAEHLSAAAELAARGRLDAERGLAARIERRTSLLKEHEALLGRAPEVGAAAARLDLGRRAGTVTAALRAHADTALLTERTRAAWDLAVDEARRGPHADLLDRTDGGTDVPALLAVHDAATAEQGALLELVELEAQLPRAEEAAAATLRSIEASAEALAEAEQMLADRPALRLELAGSLEQARRAAAEEPAARAAAQAARGVLEAAAAAQTLSAQVVAAETDVAAAAVRAREALDVEHAVRTRWVDGMAGALAAGLETGRPCAVCGSPEHPRPATPSPQHASTEQVEAATAARESADRDLGAARTALTRFSEQLAAARRAAEDRSVDQAGAELADAEARVTTAAAAAALAADLEPRLEAFDAETAALSASVTGDRSSLAVRREGLAGMRRQLAADRDRCVRARGGADSVTARARSLTARSRCARALLDARRELLTAEEAAAQAAARLRQGLADASLPDAAAARAATLPAAEIGALERQVFDHRAALDRVAAGLAEPEIAALSGTETADVGAAQDAHRLALTALTEATRAASVARGRADQATSAREDLLAALAGHAERSREAAPLLRTANLANAGDGNETSTTLATYVLLRRFEDVVAAANERLATMSDGRYALERIDEREGGQRSRKAGLGLQVRDHLTESPRDPHTLSGGETFYVSLCLALGLADVVRSEAGGIELGTLFVDEGFGSLDPATLDAVMGELGKLREGGRAVGIVSHVTELKARIAERIEVRRLPSGASTLTVRS